MPDEGQEQNEVNPEGTNVNNNSNKPGKSKKKNGKKKAKTQQRAANGSRQDQPDSSDQQASELDKDDSARPSTQEKSSASPVPENNDAQPDYVALNSDTVQDRSDAPNAEGQHETNMREGAGIAAVPGNASSGVLPENKSDEQNAKIVQLESLVSQLKLQLNQTQQGTTDGDSEAENDKSRIAQLESEKAQLDSQYRGLLAKVANIRKNVGERIKADEEEIKENRQVIDQLESKVQELSGTVNMLQQELKLSNEEAERLSKELDAYKSSNNQSNSQWAEERENLTRMEQNSRELIEQLRKEVHDWEMMAMEERGAREGNRDRMNDLEQQLSRQIAAQERMQQERIQDNSTIDGLRQALSVMQEERKKELREVVDDMQNQLDVANERASTYQKTATQAQEQANEREKEIERLRTHEKEIKEKNLLIGKLRHEAVILNEHLTKALKLLRKGSSEEMVDRQLITNLLLSFLSLPRSDTKRFEVLQLMSSMLEWNDDQRQTAGLSRPGAGYTGSTYSPQYSPALSSRGSSSTLRGYEQSISEGHEGRESVSDMFIDFLERESASRNTNASGSPRPK